MDSLLQQLKSSDAKARLVIMPISRVLVERPLTLGSFRVFPAGEMDLSRLRPVPNYSPDEELKRSGMVHLTGQRLREAATSLTGFDLKALESNAVVAFVAEIDWDDFLEAAHEQDVELLQRLSACAERALDIVRFHQCRLDLPATLPGPVGSWENSGPYLGALLYCLGDHESYLIAGEAAGYSLMSSGIGLDFDFDYPEPLPSASDGEVGAIALHALSLFSDAMYARNDTSKFLRTMTLMEFLASPGEYQNWKKAKSNIACHCAKSKQEYLHILHRLKELTSIEGPEGAQLGFRTLVIHHGKFLEDIIPRQPERRTLFRELHGYVGAVVGDMLEHLELNWEEYSARRQSLKEDLGISDAI
jgi:hypothetical protein